MVNFMSCEFHLNEKKIEGKKSDKSNSTQNPEGCLSFRISDSQGEFLWPSRVLAEGKGASKRRVAVTSTILTSSPVAECSGSLFLAG